MNIVGRRDWNPFHLKLPAKPGHLALGELARADFDQLDGWRQGTLAPQVLDDLPVADGLQRGFVLFQAALQEIARFFNQTAREHFIHAGVDAGVKIGGRTQQSVGS